MQDDTLELLISIGHFARVYRRFDEARYLFERLALLYPQRAFAYLGLGLVEVDCANYRGASRLFRKALDVAPDSALARAWLGMCQVLEGHCASGTRLLAAVAESGEPGASSMAAAFLNLPECAPYAAAARVAWAQPRASAVASLSTFDRLTLRGSY